MFTLYYGDYFTSHLDLKYITKAVDLITNGVPAHVPALDVCKLPTSCKNMTGTDEGWLYV